MEHIRLGLAHLDVIEDYEYMCDGVPVDVLPVVVPALRQDQPVAFLLNKGEQGLIWGGIFQHSCELNCKIWRNPFNSTENRFFLWSNHYEL